MLGSPVHSQTHSLPSRGPGKTQLISTSIKSSSGLSTKARIATDMAKGLASFGQPKPRYQGLTMRKNTNQPGESRSPVMPSTANPQPPVEPPRQTSLPRSSDEHSNQANQTQTRDISSPQCSLPPPPPRPQPKEPSHDPEPDRMDEDQLESVNSVHFYHFLIYCDQPNPSPTRDLDSGRGFATHNNTRTVRL